MPGERPHYSLRTQGSWRGGVGCHRIALSGRAWCLSPALSMQAILPLTSDLQVPDATHQGDLRLPGTLTHGWPQQVREVLVLKYPGGGGGGGRGRGKPERTEMAGRHSPQGVSKLAPRTPCHTHPGKTLSVGLQIPQGLAHPPPSPGWFSAPLQARGRKITK